MRLKACPPSNQAVPVPVPVNVASVVIVVYAVDRLRRERRERGTRRTNAVLLPRVSTASPRRKVVKVSHDSGTQVTVIAPGDPYAGKTRAKALAVTGVGGQCSYTHEVYHKLFQVWGALAKVDEMPASLISTRAIEHLHDYDGTFVREDGEDELGNTRYTITHQVWTNRANNGPDLVFERVQQGEDSDLLILDPLLTIEDL